MDQERLSKRDSISQSLSFDLQGTVLFSRRCTMKILFDENILIVILGVLQ